MKLIMKEIKKASSFESEDFSIPCRGVEPGVGVARHDKE